MGGRFNYMKLPESDFYSREILRQGTKDMQAKQREELLGALKARFESNMNRLLRLENSAALSFVIVATTMSSCITTVQNPTMAPGRSVAR